MDLDIWILKKSILTRYCYSNYLKIKEYLPNFESFIIWIDKKNDYSFHKDWSCFLEEEHKKGNSHLELINSINELFIRYVEEEKFFYSHVILSFLEKTCNQLAEERFELFHKFEAEKLSIETSGNGNIHELSEKFENEATELRKVFELGSLTSNYIENYLIQFESNNFNFRISYKNSEDEELSNSKMYYQVEVKEESSINFKKLSKEYSYSPLEISLIKQYILEGEIPNFKEKYERFLIYYNENKKLKKDVIAFLYYIKKQGYFIPRMNGRNMKDFQFKQFLARLFLNDKSALNNAFNKLGKEISSKPNFLQTLLDS